MKGVGAGAAVVWAVALVTSVACTAAQEHPGSPADSLLVLDVPYVAQSEALCGGAAVAMVLRYWGARGIYAEDFAAYLDPGGGGIATGDLAAAVGGLGWDAYPFRGTREAVRGHLARGRPVIALVEDRPGRYHYVVLAAWAAGGVLFHDPARAPYRVLNNDRFDRAWQAAEYWALLILPKTHPEAAVEAPERTPVPTDASVGAPCAALVRQAVAHAGREALDEAEAALLAARALCPEAPAAMLELAGLRFRQARWSEAAALAAHAAARDPEDAYAWRLLASSRFLDDDPEGALRAWNRLGEPAVDLVRVDGLRRTRYGVTARLLGVAPGDRLTPEALVRARRRLALLPGAAAAQVRYRPLPARTVEVEAAVVEQPLFWGGWMDVAALALRAFPERSVALHLTGLTGGGERLTASWRWWTRRPRLALALTAPGLPGGVIGVEGAWERQTYRVPGAFPGGDAGATRTEERRRVALRWTDWVAARWRLEAGLALDQWDGPGTHLALEGAVEHHPMRWPLAARVHAAGWVAPETGRAFGVAGLGVAWHPRQEDDRFVWQARAGLEAAAEAPLALWPGAGTGHARAPLLRAHPLLDRGVLAGKVFGRRLAYGGVEVRRRVWNLGPLQGSPAGFVDVAKAWETLATPDRRVQVDAGLGLRLDLSGGHGGLRLDLAHGLRDGATALSAGWVGPVPF